MAAFSNHLHADCREVTTGILGVLLAVTASGGSEPGSPARMALVGLVDCLGSTAPACAYLPAACLHVAGVWLAMHHPELRQLQQEEKQQEQQQPWNDGVALCSLAALLKSRAPVLAAACKPLRTAQSASRRAPCFQWPPL